MAEGEPQQTPDVAHQAAPEANAEASGARPFTVAVVGGGPVGALTAIFLAKRGWDVHLFESRKDIRNDPAAAGRSINLALSTRGIEAMRAAGVVDEVMTWVVPMKGRMIHTHDGTQMSQAYSVTGECINSVSRKRLNEYLLTRAETLPNVTLHFEHPLADVDLDKARLSFRREGKEWHFDADLVVGADGAFSRVRRVLMRKIHMKYEQEYLDHGYVELNIEPKEGGGWKMDPNHLHIWPKHSYMMIALPNPDHTFTVTLFMPWPKFETIKTPADLLSFFEAEFPDAVPLIGKEALVHDYFKNPKGALIMAKCSPFHYKGRCVVIGDAAHAMVPFYGQGMNCGMEDVNVLDSLLEFILPPGSQGRPAEGAIEKTFEEYSQKRYPDVTTMMDLALYNYVEMRHGVTDWRYLLRKKVESYLHLIFPKQIIPLYTMVSFSQIPYSEVMRRWNRQTAWLQYGAETLIAGAVVGAAYLGLRFTGLRRIGFGVDLAGAEKVWWLRWK